jgi:hypothetical protein
MEPERDADEDYFAYVQQVWSDKDLRMALRARLEGGAGRPGGNGLNP